MHFNFLLSLEEISKDIEQGAGKRTYEMTTEGNITLETKTNEKIYVWHWKLSLSKLRIQLVWTFQMIIMINSC